MSKNTASAVWTGDLKTGNGTVKLTSEAFEARYSFSSRFENGKGTNPEELIAAAHAACFSMALSNVIKENGYEPVRISTAATAVLTMTSTGPAITRIDLSTEATIKNIDDAQFQALAKNAKENCPVSKALSSVNINLNAKLID